MTSERVKEMIVAASDAIVKTYIRSEEFACYQFLQKGDVEGLVTLAREEMKDMSRSELEDKLTQLRTAFPGERDNLAESTILIKENGFEEYFLRHEVKMKVMTEVTQYMIEHPEETKAPPRHDQLTYAFDHAIKEVLSNDQMKTLSRLAREHKRTNETYREQQPGELSDPKLMGFMFGPFVDFVKNLYANDHLANGRLL
ncbi:MAG: hypothetical protein KJ709_02135 [Nanoarchaeota archaeon]|nr:hypothetical protein [Nanoarchaeota archaeon]